MACRIHLQKEQVFITIYFTLFFILKCVKEEFIEKNILNAHDHNLDRFSRLKQD